MYYKNLCHDIIVHVIKDMVSFKNNVDKNASFCDTVYVKTVEGETFAVRTKMKIQRENFCGRSFL